MGRIVVEATIENGMDPSCRIVCDILVDTGAAYLTLPNAWRSRLGELTVYDTVDVETANQAIVTGEICGPVLLRFGSFRRVLAEVLFTDMEPADGRHEPLLGYIPLEQAQAVRPSFRCRSPARMVTVRRSASRAGLTYRSIAHRRIRSARVDPSGMTKRPPARPRARPS